MPNNQPEAMHPTIIAPQSLADIGAAIREEPIAHNIDAIIDACREQRVTSIVAVDWNVPRFLPLIHALWDEGITLEIDVANPETQ